MTIVVATAAPDGLVLAADGRTTMLSGRRHRVASDHTRKVFSPFPGIGLATYGAALLSEQTIAGHVEEFAARRRRPNSTIDDISNDLAEYFMEVLDDQAGVVGQAPPPGVLGFLVAGYDRVGVGRIYDVLLPPGAGDEPVRVRDDPSTRLPGHLFRGRTRHVRRLVEGYDADALQRSGAKPTAKVEHELQRLGYLMNKPLSLQEAVDLAVFVVRLTIDMERLSDGTFAEPEEAPACGGAIQVLLVTSTGSQWIVLPKLRPGVAGLAEQG